MRSEAELRDASGYAGRPRDFDDLIRILDPELRLITPTDPEGSIGEAQSADRAAERYYQLTHDYLVHSLRDWLTRKQRETRRGRAELRLAERAALWEAKPENRHLPSVLGVGEHPAADADERLDRAAAADDAAGGRVHGLRGLVSGDPDRPGDLGRDRGLREPAGLGAGRVARDRQHDRRPGSRRTNSRPTAAGRVVHSPGCCRVRRRTAILISAPAWPAWPCGPMTNDRLTISTIVSWRPRPSNCR